MKVRLDDQLDGHAELLGVGDVFADVALGVDDDGTAGGLVADQIRRVREAVEVVLVELHDDLPSYLSVLVLGEREEQRLQFGLRAIPWGVYPSHGGIPPVVCATGVTDG